MTIPIVLRRVVGRNRALGSGEAWSESRVSESLRGLVINCDRSDVLYARQAPRVRIVFCLVMSMPISTFIINVSQCIPKCRAILTQRGFGTGQETDHKHCVDRGLGEQWSPSDQRHRRAQIATKAAFGGWTVPLDVQPCRQ